MGIYLRHDAHLLGTAPSALSYAARAASTYLGLGFAQVTIRGPDDFARQADLRHFVMHGAPQNIHSCAAPDHTSSWCSTTDELDLDAVVVIAYPGSINVQVYPADAMESDPESAEPELVALCGTYHPSCSTTAGGRLLFKHDRGTAVIRYDSETSSWHGCLAPTDNAHAATREMGDGANRHERLVPAVLSSDISHASLPTDVAAADWNVVLTSRGDMLAYSADTKPNVSIIRQAGAVMISGAADKMQVGLNDLYSYTPAYKAGRTALAKAANVTGTDSPATESMANQVEPCDDCAAASSTSDRAILELGYDRASKQWVVTAVSAQYAKTNVSLSAGSGTRTAVCDGLNSGQANRADSTGALPNRGQGKALLRTVELGLPSTAQLPWATWEEYHGEQLGWCPVPKPFLVMIVVFPAMIAEHQPQQTTGSGRGDASIDRAAGGGAVAEHFPSSGFDVYHTLEVDARFLSECKANELAGFGRFLDVQLALQRKKNRLAGLGAIPDQHVAAQRARNYQKRLGEITDHQVGTQRAQNAGRLSAVPHSPCNEHKRTNIEVIRMAMLHTKTEPRCIEAWHTARYAVDAVLNTMEWRPLHCVASGRTPAAALAARLLLATGASANAACGIRLTFTIARNATTALTIATACGAAEMVNVLLNFGADARWQSHHTGQTALHVAAARGFTHLVDPLVYAGADTGVTDSRGHTALQLAIKGKHRETAQKLLQWSEHSNDHDDDLVEALQFQNYFPDVVGAPLHSAEADVLYTALDRDLDAHYFEALADVSATLGRLNGDSEAVQHAVVAFKARCAVILPEDHTSAALLGAGVAEADTHGEALVTTALELRARYKRWTRRGDISLPDVRAAARNAIVALVPAVEHRIHGLCVRFEHLSLLQHTEQLLDASSTEINVAVAVLDRVRILIMQVAALPFAAATKARAAFNRVEQAQTKIRCTIGELTDVEASAAHSSPVDRRAPLPSAPAASATPSISGGGVGPPLRPDRDAVAAMVAQRDTFRAECLAEIEALLGLCDAPAYEKLMSHLASVRPEVTSALALLRKRAEPFVQRPDTNGTPPQRDIGRGDAVDSRILTALHLYHEWLSPGYATGFAVALGFDCCPRSQAGARCVWAIVDGLKAAVAELDTWSERVALCVATCHRAGDAAASMRDAHMRESRDTLVAKLARLSTEVDGINDELDDGAPAISKLERVAKRAGGEFPAQQQVELAALIADRARRRSVLRKTIRSRDQCYAELAVLARAHLPEICLEHPGLSGLSGSFRADGIETTRTLADYDRIVALQNGNHSVCYAEFDGEPCVLKSYDAANLDARRRFYREVEFLTRRLDHPAVIACTAIFFDPEKMMSFMQLPWYGKYINGQPVSRTLDVWLGESPRSTTEVLAVVLELLRGLDHVHSHDVIHQDIKPQNIFMNETNNPILGDFDASKDALVTAGTATARFTLEFRSPEVINDPKAASPKSDMFALGQLLHLYFTQSLAKLATLSALDGKALPGGVSPKDADAWLFVVWLLHPNPACRPTAAQAQNHTCMLALIRAQHEAVAAGPGGVGGLSSLSDGGDRPPWYWRARRLAGSSGSHMVDCSCTELPASLERLMNRLARPETHGHGRDSHGAAFQRFKVTSVTRVENPSLWKRYAATRSVLAARAWAATAADGTTPPPLADPPLTAAYELPNDCRGTLNELAREVYLFHGTKPKVGEDIIAHRGFDNRLGGPAMLGAGTYFAESPSKADQYVPVGGKHHMFLARVLLGSPHRTSAQMVDLKRPPCVLGHTGVCEHTRRDSVIFRPKNESKFREFVVYDPTSCYPEYLIEYERVHDGRSPSLLR